MNSGISHILGISAIFASVAVSSGCAHVDVNQLAYEVLSQEDCRINQLEDFCNRNFAKEYREYELIRRDFMRSQEQTVWRVNHDKGILSTASLP